MGDSSSEASADDKQRTAPVHHATVHTRPTPEHFGWLVVERAMPPLVLTACLVSAVAAAQPPATPADPTTVILNALRTHPVVALSEGQHWNLQSHAYRLSLLRDRRLAEAVNDIVVEFGDARYQEVIERYVAGGDVPSDELRHVWEDTTMTNTVFDMPIYEEFFRTVREVNRSVPAVKRLRVLLGDPPVDWAKISSGDILD